jgi:lipopolysaccharide transport system permease protein
MTTRESSTLPPRGLNARRRAQRPAHSGRYLLSHGVLLVRVTRNELAARYAGSILGTSWTFIGPALFLALYSTIYLYVYKTAIPGLTKWQFVVFVMSGLVPYLVIAEAVGSGVTSVVANRSVLANVVFPIDLLPPKAVLIAQPTMAFGMAIALIGAIATGVATWYALLVPVVWAFQVLALLGVTWILSLINVVLRDLTHVIGIVLLMLLIASPIGYTTDQVPTRLRFLLLLNPAAYFIVAYQKLLVFGTLPSALTITGIVVFSLGVFALGGWMFSRMKATMVDYV